MQHSHISSDTELSTLNNNPYYHSYSSESNNSSFDKHTEDSSHKPQQMIQQVGGVSQHKQPVLTLEPCYILKPLRLTHIQKERCKTDLNCYSGAKDGMKDKTKVYRGVREIAFYETLAFASRQLQIITSSMELMEDNATTNLSLPSIRYILSYHSAIFMPLDLADSDADDRSSCENGWSILKRVKELCIRADTWNKKVALMIAYQAGDQVVTSSIKSYISTCITLSKELKSLRKMADFTSSYYGVVDLQRMEECKHLHHPMAATSLSHPHLLLENITGNFRHPNIIDLKMGTQTYEPSAPEAKQLREIQKYTQQAEFGFRIVGMRVYDAATDEYICKDKSFGTGLMTEDEVMGALGMFFSSSNTCLTPTIDNILRQLTNIQDWFENSNSVWAFYGGSILIVYEGDDNTSNATNTDPAVRMIDFAHVCRKQGGDEGYLKGIKTLLSMLLEIRNSLSITS